MPMVRTPNKSCLPWKSLMRCCFPPVFRPRFKLTCAVCWEEFGSSKGIACQHDEDEEVGFDYHKFCAQCTREYVARNVNDLPLAPNRDGMPCMQSGCKRPIRTETLESVLPDDVLTILKRRCSKESMWLAGVESCKNDSCPYGLVIEQDKRDRPAFECPMCDAYFCRTCKRDMFPLHIEATCKQLDRREAMAERHREGNNKIYNKISDVVIRRCPRCAVGIVKEDGCNLMTCRCGMTMCYLCRAANITGDHFRGKSKCRQLDDCTVRDAPVLSALESKLRLKNKVE